MRVLVVEDDPRLGPSLKKWLESNHYAVDLVTHGEDALLLALSTAYDLLVLDVLLPRLSGFDVCKQLREQGRSMPILLLTALGEVEHRVKGLDLGADDYLVKPFAMSELEARVRALLRRGSPVKTLVLGRPIRGLILFTSWNELLAIAGNIPLKIHILPVCLKKALMP